MRIVEKLIAKLKHHGIRAVVVDILSLPFTLQRRLAFRKMLEQGTPRQRFGEIYKNKLWISDESGSGEGSEVGYTERLRNWLVTAIPKYGIRTFVDAPCGDFNWMRLVVQKVDVEYFGFDIVDFVIDENKKKYESDKVHFVVADICQDELQSCDLLMVRECLFHLSLADINRFLENISNLDYKYLLTTTFIVNEKFKNTDITTGDFRIIDLFRAPFGFDREAVVERVEDYPPGHALKREMVLIAKADVPQGLAINV